MLIDNTKIKDIKLKIGQLIKSLRKQENISQEELAKTLDLSRITIQNLESGKNATLDTLLKVLQHFELLGVLNQMLSDKISENENLESLY